MTEKLEAMRRAEETSAGRTLASYPLRLYAHHMAEIFGVTLRRLYALEGDGHFMWAENRPQIGRKSWSRERVEQYFAGTLTGLTPSKGARRG